MTTFHVMLYLFRIKSCKSVLCMSMRTGLRHVIGIGDVLVKYCFYIYCAVESAPSVPDRDSGWVLGPASWSVHAWPNKKLLNVQRKIDKWFKLKIHVTLQASYYL